MRKIPTLFLRDPLDRRVVTREVDPSCQWVIDGEGVATRKWDGTCVMHDGTRWWARREVKPNKPLPRDYVMIETDRYTGKVMGWEPIEQSAFARFHTEALASSAMLDFGWPATTYELCGPKINKNPEGCSHHVLMPHGVAFIYDAPRSYNELVVFLADFPHEGIVWHHEDGRMAKIKRRDFWGRPEVKA